MENIQLFEQELPLLMGPGQNFVTPESEINDLMKWFRNGEYDRCLTNDFIKKIFQCDLEDEFKSLDECLVNLVKNYLENGHSRYMRELAILILGAAALQLFVQYNWTGPQTTSIATGSVNEMLETLLVKHNFVGATDGAVCDIRGEVMKFLSLDEILYPKVKHPEFLYLARVFLCLSVNTVENCKTYTWWSLRCNRIHQEMLEEKSPVLYAEVMNYINKVLLAEELMTNDRYRSLQIQFHLEAAYICFFYHEFSKAKEHSHSATKLAGLTISLTGAMGKRTYFQADNKVQLKINLEREFPQSGSEEDIYTNDTPQDIRLNDETRREKIVFQNEEDNILLDFLPVEQLILLNMSEQVQRSSAVHKLIDEELLVYINAVVHNPKVWSIQLKALFLRSQVESKSRRTIERSMMQIQELVNSFSKEKPEALQRLHLFYATSLLPYWKFELKLANLLQALGAVSSAADIYLRLEIWDQLIICYQLLQRKSLAEEIIRQQLNEKETVSLWCSLGDVTGDTEYYERAWELSNHRSARAQRSFGQYYFLIKDYENCIPYFQRSLELNRLQLSVAFNLAYAALMCEKWEIAGTAYRHCVNLEPDNFQAWNNLSNVYLKLNQKSLAWKSLQEALRCDFDNWRIWENYLVVSIDCRAFEESLKAYNRVLELKEKHVDTEILDLLVKAVTENLPDIEGNSSSRLKSQLLQLFGHLTSQVTNNSHVWSLYAKLTANGGIKDECTMQKVVQYRQRAQRSAVLHSNWEKNADSCQNVVNLCLDLANTYLQYTEMIKENELKHQAILSAKLMLKGVITTLKAVDFPDPEKAAYLEPLLSSLQEKLDFIEVKLRS